MPGPTPKHPSLRARRNRNVTAATLAMPDPDAETEVPDLPPRRRIEKETGEAVEVEWHPMALAFWDEVWTSPMAAEFLDSDVHGLYVVLTLTDNYWKNLETGKPTTGLAMELRLQRQQFGLDPIARRRLQWEVEKVEDAVAKGQKRRRSEAVETPALPPSGDGFAALR